MPTIVRPGSISVESVEVVRERDGWTIKGETYDKLAYVTAFAMDRWVIITLLLQAAERGAAWEV